jgi:Ca2+/Na+ antiporter
VGVLSPLPIDFSQIWTTIIFLFLALAYLFYVIHKKVMYRHNGLVLAGLYAVFLTIEIIKIVQ